MDINKNSNSKDKQINNNKSVQVIYNGGQPMPKSTLQN